MGPPCAGHPGRQLLPSSKGDQDILIGEGEAKVKQKRLGIQSGK